MEVQDKIKAYTYLEDGWHYGEGRNSFPKATEVALFLVEEFKRKGWEKMDAFPDINGSVLLCVYDGDLCYEFTANEDGKIDYREEKRNGGYVEQADHEGLTKEEASELLWNKI